MLLRVLSSVMLLPFIAAATITTASANPSDPLGIYTGGAPLNRLFGGIYGGSPVPRTTVSFPTNEKPGTIIVNTRALSHPRGWPCAPLRHWRRPRRLHLGRREDHHRQA
jgi:hypothetical protein